MSFSHLDLIAYLRRQGCSQDQTQLSVMNRLQSLETVHFYSSNLNISGRCEPCRLFHFR